MPLKTWLLLEQRLTDYANRVKRVFAVLGMDGCHPFKFIATTARRAYFFIPKIRLWTLA